MGGLGTGMCVLDTVTPKTNQKGPRVKPLNTTFSDTFPSTHSLRPSKGQVLGDPRVRIFP